MDLLHMICNANIHLFMVVSYSPVNLGQYTLDIRIIHVAIVNILQLRAND